MPDPDQMNADPKPWRKVAKSTIDGVDAVTTWTHIFFAGENTPAAVKVQRDERDCRMRQRKMIQKCQ
jgi:hypothetical protein